VHGDAILAFCSLERYKAVVHVVGDPSRVALERVPPSAAATRVVHENVACFEQVVAAALDLFGIGARIDDDEG